LKEEAKKKVGLPKSGRREKDKKNEKQLPPW
jgi:hypothetical protein